MMPQENETREAVLKNPVPDWFAGTEGLFWKECEENFAIAMTQFVQDVPENFENDVFAVKIHEMSRLERYQ